MKTIYKAALLAGCLTGLATHAGQVTDNFSVTRDYLTQGVAGTIWDGIYTGAGQIPGGNSGGGPGATTVMNANGTNAGKLTITSTQTEWEGGNNDGVLMFKLVHGDFDMEVHIDSHQVIDYHHSGLLARLPDLSDGGPGEDNVSWTRFDQFSIANYFRTEDAGVTTQRPLVEVNPSYWLRLQRVGDTFTAYEKVAETDEWVQRDQQERTDMTGLPVQVGLMQALYSGNSGTVQFSAFKLSGPNVNVGPYASPATGLTAATNSPGAITLSWTPGAGSDGSLVVVRANGPVFRQPSDGLTYTADTAFGAGTDLGVGTYAVYVGTGSSVTISNMPGGAQLSAAVFAYKGTAYSQTTPPVVSFGAPAVMNGLSLFTTSPILFGGQGQATVYAKFDNGSSNAVTAQAVYSLSPTGIVSVSAAGVLTPLTNGSASLVASFTGPSGTFSATNSLIVTNLGSATLKHRYSFNETSGESATDSVGGAHGTLMVGAAFDQAGAVVLDGTAAYVDLPNGILTNLTNITVEAWFTDNASATWARLFDFGNSAGGEDTSTGGTSYMFLSVPVGANFRAVYGIPGEQIMEAPRPPAQQKVHVVWVSEGPGHYGRLYVNGSLVASNNAMSIIPAALGNTLNNWLGRSQFGSDPYFNGSIDEFRIWNGAISPLQVAVSSAAGPNTVVQTPGALTAVTVSAPATLIVGSGAGATAFGNYANVNGVPLAGQPGLAFSSSDPSILDVSPTGTITAVGVGTASVRAHFGSLTGTASITVGLPANIGTYTSVLAGYAPEILFHLDETNAPPAPNVATNRGTLGFSASGGLVGAPMQQTPGALVGSSDTSVTIVSGGQYILAPYQPSFSTKPPFTVEAWLNPGAALAAGGLTCPLSLGHLADPRSGWIIYQSDTGWNFRTYAQSGLATAISITGGGAPVPGTWYHVVVSFDGTNANLYVNGALAATGSSPNYVPNTDGPLVIGARGDLAFPWVGSVDEVAIYTNALTGTQIAAHYSNGTSATPATPYDQLVLGKAPQLYFRLNDVADTATTPPPAYNSGSLGSANDGTYEGGVAVGAPGVSLPGLPATNKTATFNGIVGGVTSLGSPLSGLANFSIVGWFKPVGATQTARTSLVGQNDAIEFYYDTANRIGLYTAGGGQFISADTTGVIVPDAWNLIAGVGDGTNIFIYINGKQVAKGGSAVANYGSSAFPLNIGAGVADATGGVYRGQIDEVAVFTTKALSPTEIATLYYAAAQTPAFIAQPAAPAAPLAVGSTYTLTATAAGSPVLTYQWFKDGTALTGKTLSSLALSPVASGDAGNYSLVVTNGFGAITSSIVAVTIESGVLEITIERSGSNIILTWPSGVLQSSDTVTGGYSDVTGATSPRTVVPSEPMKFYQLRQ